MEKESAVNSAFAPTLFIRKKKKIIGMTSHSKKWLVYSIHLFLGSFIHMLILP